MVRHIVLWRLHEEAKRTAWSAQASCVGPLVRAMRAQVRGLLRLELALNQTDAADAADLLLFSEFESWDALRAYETHPLHDELRILIGALRSERRVLNYEPGLELSSEASSVGYSAPPDNKAGAGQEAVT